MNDLDELAIKHDTDKACGRHNYTRLYHHFFAPFRDQPITLLELGVAWGGSIRMWRDYFPNGTIIGVDTFLECPTTIAALADVDVELLQVDQADPQLPELIYKDELPLRIVIDDCSHIPEKTFASFEMLWPLVADGGFYAIEDLGIHGHPYDELINNIRKYTDVWLLSSHHPDVPHWKIAIAIKEA